MVFKGTLADRVGIERWCTQRLINHKLTSGSDVTMTNYTVKSDRSDLRPQVERIAAWIEEQRSIAGGKNIIPLYAKAKKKGQR